MPDRYKPTPLEVQQGTRRRFQELGYRDRRAGKPMLSRERLRELGGEHALRSYYAGWRGGGKVS